MRSVLFLVWGALLALPTLAADWKIGILDLDQTLKSYYRTRSVERQLAEMQTSLAKEFQGLRLEGERRFKAAESLRAQSRDEALSLATRQEKQRDLETSLLDLRSFEIKYESFRRDAESEYQDKARRLNQELLADVFKVTYELGRGEGFHLILKSSPSNPAAGDVLFAQGIEDVTPKVVAQLNARKPVDLPQTPAAMPGDKPQP